MTYTFPPSLHPLRDYLKGQGADTKAFVSARQAAFMAQQLLGTRVKFPAQGADMTSTLFLIQKAVTEGHEHKTLPPGRTWTKKKSSTKTKGRSEVTGKSRDRAKKQKDYSKFTPDLFAEGIHIFCDGAAVPNPGVGGWGVVAYENGKEIDSNFGGAIETTNNVMELTAMLNAIEEAWKDVAERPLVTIWCDSQYVVKGCNEWRHKWKKQGWNRRGENSLKRGEDSAVKNVDLWIAIDKQLELIPEHGILEIRWVKGHIGIAGNERADELAEMGRQEAADQTANLWSVPVNELDEQYRQIMGTA